MSPLWSFPGFGWGLPAVVTFLLTIACLPNLLLLPSQGFLLCRSQLVHPPPRHWTLSACCAIFTLVACVFLSCWQERAIVLSKSAAHKSRFGETGLNSIQFPKVEIPQEVIYDLGTGLILGEP